MPYFSPWGETADTPGWRTAQAKDATVEKGHHCLQTLSGPGLMWDAGNPDTLAFWMAGGWICTQAVVRQEFTLIRDQTKTVNMRSPVIKCSILAA